MSTVKHTPSFGCQSIGFNSQVEDGHHSAQFQWQIPHTPSCGCHSIGFHSQVVDGHHSAQLHWLKTNANHLFDCQSIGFLQSGCRRPLLCSISMGKPYKPSFGCQSVGFPQSGCRRPSLWSIPIAKPHIRLLVVNLLVSRVRL